MRMRRKKHGTERRKALAQYLLPEDCNMTNSPANCFPFPDAPLHLEIGCGKGDFAIGMAQKNPEINFIAMERVPDVILCAMEKCATTSVTNLRFLIGNANTLTDLFPKDTFSCIYLNFSDPWPKSGHTKRRLTYRDFLKQYEVVLKDKCPLIFKTDNRELFDYSLRSFYENNWSVHDVTYNLHISPYNEGNVVTEYERNFSEKGFPIHRCIAFPPLKKED